MFLICYGTRPEIIKLFPLIQSFKNNNMLFKTLFTGQHEDLIENFSSLVPKPDYILKNVMIKDQSINKLTSKIISKMEDILINSDITDIIIQGDTTSAFAIALSGFYNKINIIHLEAGLRTLDKQSPFPEEANRCLISQITNVHLAPTVNAENNLIKENIKNNVYNVGNTIVDSYDYVLKNIPIPITIKNIVEKYKNYIVITLHRRENKINLPILWKQLNELSQNYNQFKFIYIKHPSIPNVCEYLIENILLIDPLDYISMVHLIKNSAGIISDSGGLQEEAVCANKKILICRNTTERPETIDYNYGKLIDCDITNNFNFLFDYSNINNSFNPYGSTVCEKIIKILSTK